MQLMSRRARVLTIPYSLLFSLCLVSATPVLAADPFEDQVLPFLKTYCVQCHNKEKSSGELDLTRYTAASKMIEDFRQWEHVVTFLKKEEMPPAKATQPTATLRAEILTALEQVMVKEARQLAGDPGVVPPRRLSNAEFDYTIHDLTGVDIRPAATFPLDPASGEGFNNTGEALTMSPALFKKYYGAARHVADHALLTTSGIQFAPYPVITFTDRQKYFEEDILKFYEQHKVEYEAYLAALWSCKHRLAAGQSATLEEWAKEKNLSPKYLKALWEALEGNTDADTLFLSWLRQRWNALPTPKVPPEPVLSGNVAAAISALAADIRRLSQRLCPHETLAIIAHLTNNPIDHLARRRRTANSRDTFDIQSLTRQRFTCEFTNAAGKPSLKLVIQAADLVGMKVDGFVIVNGGFTTDFNPEAAKLAEAEKTKWTLRAVLAEHAPDQLKKLAFGVHPDGKAVDRDALVIKAPGSVEIDIPTEAVKTRRFFADCRLEGSTHGFVQLRLLDRLPEKDDNGLPAQTERRSLPERNLPAQLLCETGHANAKKIQASGAAFCRLFPNRFYFVDSTRGLSAGFHLIEGVFRDDQPLCKLVLTDAENQKLDRLWTELPFVTDIWQKMLRGFVFYGRGEQRFLQHPDFDSVKGEDPELIQDGPLIKFRDIYLRRVSRATGDALAKDPSFIFFEDIRNGLKDRAEKLKRAEPIYLSDLENFARRAYRRPLTDPELGQLRKFYWDVCQNKELGVEQAVGASITRILMSPYFCYHAARPPAGTTIAPLSDFDLAARMSYFIWESMPDEELFALARSGKLHEEKVLREQTRRMLKDPKVGRFALEFFGQWFGYREFLKNEAVNRQVFPSFDDGLRQAMFEEPTRLATYLIQQDRPITALLHGDNTFVNRQLAQHYGVPFAGKDGDWELATDLHKLGRGGVLGMAVFLTKNSQPQRTSPVKRGFWVIHKLLGEHIPPPPADVAVLPAKETDTNGKTIRQLLALHTSDAHCARCHVRFDSVGLAMEGFDPIGKARTRDLAGREIDDVVHLPSGKDAHGVPEFSQYLISSRRRDFTKTLNQKFLGFALNRSLQLSDRLLLEALQASLDAHEDQLGPLFEAVITSPQFRDQRCRDFSIAEFTAQKKRE
jgi:hypothetical protein